MRISRLFPLLSAMLLLTAPASKAGKTAQTGRSALACPTCCKTCCTPELSKLPREVFSGVRGPFHVQGIAVDLKNGYMYFSFTTELLKTDLQGKLIGSVKGMTGHLGCLTVNPEDGRVYGSLEYKNDEIGRGILRQLNKEGNGENPSDAFYVAIFDVDKITRPDMDAETDGVMKAVYLKEVVDDYYGTAVNGGREVKHRLGCSGIDGISFGPAFGAPKGSKPYLNVAYGIYGDTTRSDNDYQVILNYDPETWKQYEQTLTQQAPHRSGPAAPDHKYFVRTGNTSYGIQNLAYDCASGNWYAAVYFHWCRKVNTTPPAASGAGSSNGGPRACVRSEAAISTFHTRTAAPAANCRAARCTSTNGRATPKNRSGWWNNPAPPYIRATIHHTGL